MANLVLLIQLLDHRLSQIVTALCFNASVDINLPQISWLTSDVMRVLMRRNFVSLGVER